MNIFNSDFCWTEYNSEVIKNDNYLLDDLKDKKEIINNCIFISDKVKQPNDYIKHFEEVDEDKVNNPSPKK